MFVGHGGVGKTTLATGLLGIHRDDIQSTDGIEVHIGRCYIDKSTGKWYQTNDFEGMFFKSFTSISLMHSYC